MYERYTNPTTRLWRSLSTRDVNFGLMLLLLFLILLLMSTVTVHNDWTAPVEHDMMSSTSVMDRIPSSDDASNGTSQALFPADASNGTSQASFPAVNNRSADDKCGAWSSAIFQPQDDAAASVRTTWQKVELDNGLVQTNWVHHRSGAPSATGVLRASVFYSTKPCDASNEFLSASVTKESSLCSHTPAINAKTPSTGNTIVLSLSGAVNWEEAFSRNVWHYHAAIFRCWAGLQIASYVALSNGLKAQDWVVILLPKQVWPGTKWARDGVFLLSPENLASAFESRSDAMSTMVSLQGLADACGGRVVIARDGVSMGLLRAVLEQNNAPVDVGMWVSPPADGLIWDLAWDANLSPRLSGCRNSILLQYRNDLLNSVPSQGTPEVARHVCLVSRQGRGLRSLSPSFALKLLGRLGAPLVVTPSLSLRTGGNTTDGFPLQLDKSSHAGQIRLVYDECAVLLGVHGAGLTNAMGLRPGTSVIELQMRGMTYQYFRNVASLMADVDHTVFLMQGSGPAGKDEVNLAADDKGLLDLYELVQKKLEDSMRRQAIHRGD